LRVGASNETVVLKMDSCGAWDTLGSSTTNRDGRAMLPNNQMAAPGRFKVSQQMLANGTAITSTVNVLPAGTHVVVFDVDGTLTTDNGQFIRQQLHPEYVPVAFEAAQAATQAWVAKGYVVLYLSGRPTDSAVQTRTWLDDLGFAKGPTHLTEFPSQVVPSTAGVGAFKKAYIQSLMDKGYVIDYAYGNETTDIYAYAGVGLSADKIFILGPNAGASGTQPLPNGYTDNLAFIAAAPNAGQPFSF
jgi:phosphatidate phosphatase PAH1